MKLAMGVFFFDYNFVFTHPEYDSFRWTRVSFPIPAYRKMSYFLSEISGFIMSFFLLVIQ